MSAVLHRLSERVRAFEPTLRLGRVTRISSTHVEADGPDAPVGSVCALEQAGGEVLAMLVSIDQRRVVLAPLDDVRGLRLGAQARLVSTAIAAEAGDAFLGRAVDGLGRPIDGRPAVTGVASAEEPVRPLDRVTPRKALVTGVRAIDGLTPLAQGQRIGIFAAPGVGKTTLLAQLAAQVEADRCVVCLVGERGREVEALWSGMDDDARGRTVMVAATSDETAAMRVQAVEQALTLAARWRSEGRHVLLLLDSATRYAMALREIGLAAGEPPTVRAYTPGVFAALPRLVERCGAVRGGGAITAAMTVLSETDDVDDPITEVMKSLLDGHIVLSRRIAEQGRYPAVDAPRSISRLATLVMSEEHRALAAGALASMSAYDAARTLIDAGVYVAGSNAETDAAVRRRPALEAFLDQGRDGASSMTATLAGLARALEA
jgi:flagellum-specific ATP synthase